MTIYLPHSGPCTKRRRARNGRESKVDKPVDKPRKINPVAMGCIGVVFICVGVVAGWLAKEIGGLALAVPIALLVVGVAAWAFWKESKGEDPPDSKGDPSG